MDLTIAKTQDTALIHALTQAAFAEYGREPGTSTALKETEEAIARQFMGGMQALVVYQAAPLTPAERGDKAESDSLFSPRRAGVRGEALACVRYQIEGDALYFHRLSVHPDYRRQGLAKKLVGHLEALARAQGLVRLTCSVRLQKADNVALYTGLGFQLLGERSVCRDGTAVPTGDFEKPLPKISVGESMHRYLELPRLAQAEVEELWLSDFYGVTGILRWLGKLYWHFWLGINDETRSYRGIAVLNEQETVEEIHWYDQLVRKEKDAVEFEVRHYHDHAVIAWFDPFEQAEESK
jgi:ribosomal protein S18 acetylase RimI-like enzyme